MGDLLIPAVGPVCPTSDEQRRQAALTIAEIAPEQDVAYHLVLLGLAEEHGSGYRAIGGDESGWWRTRRQAAGAASW